MADQPKLVLGGGLMRRVFLLAVVVLALAPASAGGELLPSPLPEPTRHKRCGTATATEAVNYVWYEARAHLGAWYSNTPRFRFTQGPYLAMEVKPGKQDRVPELRIARWSRFALTGVYGCPMKREAQATLVHEFAHIYQQPWVREGEVTSKNFEEAIPEGLAEAFAQNVMREVFGFSRKQYDLGWDVYDAYAREMRRKYPPPFISRGQFGSNWGMDPSLIEF